jgi:hypothetical protein
MTKSITTTVAFATMFACGLLSPSSDVTAQDNVLAELYGRGVHAFYAGRQFEAQQYLTSAINNGLDDPRVYYFRGILANSQGRTYDAESDWKEGARLEASGTTNVAIGRSLSRFQGTPRLKLEEIRREARLQAMSGAPTRSQVRMNEIQAAQPPLAAAPARPPVPASSKPIAPPPIPPTPDNPFADDTGLAAGQPKVENDDALADAMNNPFKDDGSAPDAGAGGGADVFAGGDDAGADPFGGGADAGGDPFGGGADAGADPFGGDDSGGAMDDPFGGSDPFGN